MYNRHMARRLCEGFDRCVYCGKPGTPELPLSEEHLFPQGAGGDVVIPSASCGACRDATSAFELSCLRNFYGATRAYLGLYGSRRPETRPTTLPVISLDGDIIEDVPVQDFPFVAIRLEMPPPGILVGRERVPNGIMVTDYGLRTVTLPSAVEHNKRFERRYPGGVLKLEVPISDYYRMLAKVGHCLTAARFGLDGFRPALAEYVRAPGGEINEGSYFIGGAFAFGQRVEEIGHAPHAHYAMFLREYESERWIVVRVQLFAPIGAVYDVFTGWLM